MNAQAGRVAARVSQGYIHLLDGGDGHRLWNQRVRVGTPAVLVTRAVTPLSELDFPVTGGCKR